MSVNPDAVAVMPSVPISRDPNVINSSVPVAGTMDIIRLIADSDTDPDCIRGRSRTAHTTMAAKSNASFFIVVSSVLS